MISVIILTKNSEEMIKACLESVKWADEIIVVDDNSKDQTIEVAKSYGARIVEAGASDFSQKRNLGMKEAKKEWVLYVDSDERVLQPLQSEILTLVQKDEKSAYALSRKNIIFGKEVNYGPYRHDWVIRLFKKGMFKEWLGEVHEYGTFMGDLGYAKNPLLHLTHRNIDQVVLKSLEWSKIDAQLRLKANHPKMTGWRFIRILTTETLKQGFRRGGFFGGTVGVIDSMLQVYSLFITYVRLWQMQQKRPLDQIYREVDKKLIASGFKDENWPV